jgi:hypothetical protein
VAKAEFKLRKCPFCKMKQFRDFDGPQMQYASEPHSEHSSYARCMGCGASGPRAYSAKKQTAQDAADGWNGKGILVEREDERQNKVR